MISVVTFLWGEKYRPEHVATLERMVARHYAAPFRFFCVTNQPLELAGVECVPDRNDFADVANPHGPQAPTCYRRMALFRLDAAETFGERIVQLDLDTVLVGDMRPLWDRADDFVIWQDPLYAKQGCGSMWMLRAGSQSEVWRAFKREPWRVRDLAFRAGYRGSDQAAISYLLPHTARWTRADGVYSHRVDCKAGLPAGAKAVFFHGRVKPWDAGLPAWVAQSYH